MSARSIGRLNVYRSANASWYGPGLYGNQLGCGGTLSPGRIGVAHKSLPCGSRLTLRHGARTVRVRVIDRGPYVGGREFDLTEATARRLHFRGHGAILTHPLTVRPAGVRWSACRLRQSASSPTSTATLSTRRSSCCGTRSWSASR